MNQIFLFETFNCSFNKIIVQNHSIMMKVAYGIPWIPKNLVETYLTTNWKILDYTQMKINYDEIASEKPEVIVSFSPPEEIRSIPSIKWIITPGAGIDKLPIDLIQKQGQQIINCHGNAITVAEHAWALLLAASRNIAKYDYIIRQEGKWPSRNQIGDMNYDLHGKTLGIIGYGEIAKRIITFASVFSMEVLVIRKHPEKNQFHFSILQDIADELDYLIIACPLTDESRNLVDENILQALPSSCIIVNIARGEIIDEIALIDVLREGKIRAAAIDVWKNSPYGGKEGISPDELITVPNLIISPHRAWVSKTSFGLVAQQIANELDNIASGTISNNIVNLSNQY